MNLLALRHAATDRKHNRQPRDEDTDIDALIVKWEKERAQRMENAAAASKQELERPTNMFQERGSYAGEQKDGMIFLLSLGCVCILVIIINPGVPHGIGMFTFSNKNATYNGKFKNGSNEYYV